MMCVLMCFIKLPHTQYNFCGKVCHAGSWRITLTIIITTPDDITNKGQKWVLKKHVTRKHETLTYSCDFFCQPIVKSPSESVQKKSMHSLVYFSCYGLGSEVQFLAFYLKKQPCSGSLKFPVLKIFLIFLKITLSWWFFSCMSIFVQIFICT